MIVLSFSATAQKNGKFNVPKFQKLDLKDGLSNLNVSSIVQDDLGYIWIATARGINRYDGTSIEQYFYSENENSLYNDMVVTLHKNDQGIIFCSTSYGINVFDTKKNKILRIGTEHGSFGDIIDADNKTYGISYISGLCVYKPSKKSFERLPHIANDKLLRNLIADDKTGIWASSVNNILTYAPHSAMESQETPNQVLVNYNTKTDAFAKFEIPNLHGEYSNGPIVKIDSLILLSGKAYNIFNINSQRFTPVPEKWSNLNRLSGLEIWSIEHIDNNTLWIGTRTKGLY
ncbi:MAG: hypothetical protein GY751_18675, partial [Bacteroidetes bacterium]|nr:hypothetical protein [Bacteroidota bacterium]